ncbi:MAG: hypothetical protein ACR2N2_05265 [Acidimicrobiia bacterium]
MTTQVHESHWDPPTWSFDGSAYRFENYMIEHVADDDGGWILTVGAHWPAVYAGSVDGRYERLGAAKAWMRIHRMRVIRRAKIIRHAFLSAIGIGTALIGFQIVGDEVSRLTIPAIALVLGGIMLFMREMLGLINHLAGDTDFFEMYPQTRVDAALMRQLERLAPPPRPAETDQPLIRIVDPF